MAIGGELHADEEAVLLDQGSRQSDLWGINLYPDSAGAERVEFDSMINVRPAQGNRSRVGRGPRAARTHPGGREPADPRMTTPAPRHPGLAAGRWQRLSLAEQLANVGAEVGRMRRRRRCERARRRLRARAGAAGSHPGGPSLAGPTEGDRARARGTLRRRRRRARVRSHAAGARPILPRLRRGGPPGPLANLLAPIVDGLRDRGLIRVVVADP